MPTRILAEKLTLWRILTGGWLLVRIPTKQTPTTPRPPRRQPTTNNQQPTTNNQQPTTNNQTTATTATAAANHHNQIQTTAPAQTHAHAEHNANPAQSHTHAQNPTAPTAPTTTSRAHDRTINQTAAPATTSRDRDQITTPTQPPLTPERIRALHAQVARNVARLRKARELSQLDLSLAIGCKSVSLVAGAESGYKNTHFNLEHLFRIAQALGCDVREFFAGTGGLD